MVPSKFWFYDGLLLLLDIYKNIMRHTWCGRTRATLCVSHDLAEVVAFLGFKPMCYSLN
jgi:hypothetical protein